MKSSTASGRNGKFTIVVITCTCWVLQEMSRYSGERSFCFKASDWLARKGQCASVFRSIFLKNGFRCMLLNPLLQPFVFVFFVFVHIYPPFTRKRIVSLYFGRDVRTRLGVAIFEVSGPSVFHIKTVKCLA